MTPQSKKPHRRNRRRILPLVIAGVVVVVVGGGGFALVRNIIGALPPPPKQVVQEVQLIRPPPPPPEPPPPPPPPQEEEKVEIPNPQQPPDPTPSNEPPPAANLGLDTEGGAGGDAFGLVGNKGGREITAVGGSAFAWYAGQLKDRILSELTDDKQLHSGNYRVTVRAWVREDGSVDRMEIVKGSGDQARDRQIAADLQHVKRLPQARPAGMPDVISFEVVSRG
jgi:periplasmic protein TonB